MAPAPVSSTAKTMVVPTHSGVSGDSRTDQTTRPSSAGSTSRSSILLPEREATSRMPPGSADPAAGLHQDEIASVVRRAASTASAGAATFKVLSKSCASVLGVAAVCGSHGWRPFQADHK